MNLLYGITVILFCFSGFSLSEIPDSLIRKEANEIIRGQIGDPYLWPQSVNGGYILRFSADIDNDGQAESFIGSTMGSRHTSCMWAVYSDDQLLGSVSLLLNGFSAIQTKDGLNFPTWEDKKQRGFAVTNQVFKNGSFVVSRNDVDWEEFSQMKAEWDSKGRKFTPKVQAILLTDYAAGDRAWRDITPEKCKTTESNHIYLAEDEERLSQVVISPEQALALLEKNHPENKKNATNRAGSLNETGPRESQRRKGIETDDDTKSHVGIFGWFALFGTGLMVAIVLLFRKSLIR